MVRSILAHIYSLIERGLTIPEQLCSAVNEECELPDKCAVSLCLRLLHRQRSNHENRLLLRVLSGHPTVLGLVRYAYPSQVAALGMSPEGEPRFDRDIQLLIERLRNHSLIGHRPLAQAVTEFLEGSVSDVVMAMILAMISNEGMSDTDTAELTLIMMRSGQTFDYRHLATQHGCRIVRRYPTGGVSEKVALILPSVLMALSGELPLMSLTFVGRTLGFTGGTWDKLGAIPGFVFPEPGPAIEEMLVLHRVAMCTTGTSVSPADRELYSLRSEIGTIRSTPLIVSSIASKHLALPAHRLLLDVRFGPGAFLESQTEAELLGKRLSHTLAAGGIPTDFLLTDTDAMTGCAIGNLLEVAEAVAVMGGPSGDIPWHKGDLRAQKEIVVAQVVELLADEFKHLRESRSVLSEQVAAYFDNGKVLRAFNALLKAHEVPSLVADQICTTPGYLFDGLEWEAIVANDKGFVYALDQMSLGNCVNFGLRSAGQTSPGSNRSGILLRQDLGSEVNAGDVLALVFATKSTWDTVDKEEIRDMIAACFKIGPPRVNVS